MPLDVVEDEESETVEDTVVFPTVIHGEEIWAKRNRRGIIFMLVWPTSWTPAVGGVFVCE